METVFRASSSRVNVVVGPMVMGVGVLTAVAAVVLSLVVGTAGFLALLIPAVLALGGGAFVLWGALRSRLRIDAEGFVWAGFVGAERSVRWPMLERLVPPAPGDHRLVATALLRDGTQVPCALWQPVTFPRPQRRTGSLGGGPRSGRRSPAVARRAPVSRSAHRTT